MALIRPSLVTKRLDARTGDLDVRIDELVLHGFGHADRYAVAEAVERELTRLLREEATPHGWFGTAADGRQVALHHFDAGAFELPQDAGPRTMGIHLAQAIHSGLAARQHGGDRRQVR
jgi:hypothetical protein